MIYVAGFKITGPASGEIMSEPPVPDRHPFSISPCGDAPDGVGSKLAGDAEVYRAQNDERAFIVCVFTPGTHERRGAVRVTLHTWSPSHAALLALALPGVCPHYVGVLDPPR